MTARRWGFRPFADDLSAVQSGHVDGVATCPATGRTFWSAELSPFGLLRHNGYRAENAPRRTEDLPGGEGVEAAIIVGLMLFGVLGRAVATGYFNAAVRATRPPRHAWRYEGRHDRRCRGCGVHAQQHPARWWGEWRLACGCRSTNYGCRPARLVDDVVSRAGESAV